MRCDTQAKPKHTPISDYDQAVEDDITRVQERCYSLVRQLGGIVELGSSADVARWIAQYMKVADCRGVDSNSSLVLNTLSRSKYGRDLEFMEPSIRGCGYIVHQFLENAREDVLDDPMLLDHIERFLTKGVR